MKQPYILAPYPERYALGYLDIVGIGIVVTKFSRAWPISILTTHCTAQWSFDVMPSSLHSTFGSCDAVLVKHKDHGDREGKVRAFGRGGGRGLPRILKYIIHQTDETATSFYKVAL